jgi:transglutaminase-like putative cysteine protease
MRRYLEATPTIDWQSQSVRALATQLRGRGVDPRSTVRACFEYVRDRIPHTADHNLDPVTCSASDVLEQGTGFCYAKSHLLAALLRANDVPAGFVYQRLSDGDGSFCLHGLNAVWLPDCGWYRLDARGTRSGLVSEFTPPRERLPFACTGAGERLFPGVWASPVPHVLAALRSHRRREDLLRHLPDAEDLGPADTDAPV